MKILVDTNILLRVIEPGGPDYALVRQTLTAAAASGHTLCIVPQSLVEFWNVCTRPASANGMGLTPEEADVRATLIEGMFTLLADNERIHEEWRRLVVDHAVRGVKVHDARIAAAMRVHGVSQLLTFNARDFLRFPNVAALMPGAVLPAEPAE